MKHLQAFFNKEVTEYVCDALGHMNATETEDDNDVKLASSLTASNHQLGRETNNEASHQQTADGNLDGDQDLASAAINFLPHFAFYMKNHVIEPVNVGNAFEQRHIEPTTFWEAYDHPNPKQHAKWRAAIQKEFHNMNQHGVWCKVRCSSISKRQQCIQSKWVFKIKRNRVFMPNLSPAGIVKSPELILQRTLLP